jgi:hypothetical protein
MSTHPTPLPPVELWTQIAAPAPWQAAVLPVAAWAEESGQVPPRSARLDALLAAQEQQGLRRQLYLQVWKMGRGPVTPLFSDHAAAWSASMGLGIWPNGEPPKNWDDTAAFDAMAATLEGREVPLPSHRLFSLSPKGNAASVATTLTGYGALLQTFSTLPAEESQKLAWKLYGARLTGKFRYSRFLAPLLDAAAVGSARDAHELETWLCGAHTYVRESGEDAGILILSRHDLSTLLQER